MKEKKQFQLSKLVEHLSHELRTPLSAILGYSELLKKSKNLDESDKNHLEKIAFSGNQLLDVINDIIEISNIESGKIEPEENLISTKELTNELTHKFGTSARLKEIDLLVSFNPKTGKQIKGDGKKIKTIIYSLVNNAIKFTEKGKVEVLLSLLENPENTEEQILQVCVNDTGIGISKEEMKYIFEPFRQVNTDQKRGTGLGLTTCQKLVDFLGGTLEIESETGKGTQVELQIPVKHIGDKRIKPVTIKKGPLVNTSQSLRALIVDDLLINRKLARIMLEMKNFDIIEAENGKEALDYYLDQTPDVVLMDISMPVMDGIEAMERIRQINKKESKQIPIIAITAGGHTSSRSELINRGFSEYIQKPYKEKELFEKISLFLPVAKSGIRKKILKSDPVKV